jgi:hypothetical protein
VNPAAYRLTQSAARILVLAHGEHQDNASLAETLQLRLSCHGAYGAAGGPTRDECVRALRLARIELLEAQTNARQL